MKTDTLEVQFTYPDTIIVYKEIKVNGRYRFAKFVPSCPLDKDEGELISFDVYLTPTTRSGAGGLHRPDGPWSYHSTLLVSSDFGHDIVMGIQSAWFLSEQVADEDSFPHA